MEALSFKAKEMALILQLMGDTEGSRAGEWPSENDVREGCFGNGVDRMDYREKTWRQKD